MSRLTAACAAALALFVLAAVATAAGPPPPPKAASGQTVTVLARNVPTPTSFAFGAGQVFVGGFGDEQNPKVTGGVYIVKGGKATKLAGSPAHVAGLAYQGGILYVSSGHSLLEWSGWNGKRFTHSRLITKGPKGFSGFNGIALGPDGLLYVGVGLGGAKTADFKHGATPLANDFLSVDPKAGEIKVVATGLRQPWQPTFLPGQSLPLVSDLGQENLGKKKPSDYVVQIKQGANFGFPDCPAKPATCSKYEKPFAQFPAHSSAMGLAPLGGKLYIAFFGGLGKGPAVGVMPQAGGAVTPFLSGFVAPVVALGTSGGKIYAGDLTGAVYSVKP
jgi:glucose/arabinose dehydrogenase